MSSLARAALVAQLEQRLEGGPNWDRMFARLVSEVCEPPPLTRLLDDRELYAELEWLVFEALEGELEAV